MESILEAHNIRVERGGVQVLKVDHISVQAGEVLAVFGPNRAGKSTPLMVLSPLLPPPPGNPLFYGKKMGLEKTPA